VNAGTKKSLLSFSLGTWRDFGLHELVRIFLYMFILLMRSTRSKTWPCFGKDPAGSLQAHRQ
jgi:hypothetical protein